MTDSGSPTATLLISCADRPGLVASIANFVFTNGGNIINPDKPLDRAALTRNGITDAAAIVAIMRKPAPGMLTFGPDILSEAEAEKIADYILDTF